MKRRNFLSTAVGSALALPGGADKGDSPPAGYELVWADEFDKNGPPDPRKRSGLWPAFWTLGSARPWPGCGEVDVMEFYRGTLLANVIWAGGEGGKYAGIAVKKPVADFADPAWSSRFHVWRMDWDAQRIRLFVDGALLSTVDLHTTLNKDAASANPFREPHYLLLLAIGGKQGGGPRGGESLPGGDPADTTFPARFGVDHVRVYQKQSAAK